MTNIPSGTIVPYLGGANSTPPPGWLYCNGLPVSYTTYPALFVAIGTTYNTSGEGAGNFRLPGQTSTYGGRYLKSSGSGSAGGASYSLPSTDLRNHTHSPNFAISGNLPNANHTHSYNAATATTAETYAGGHWAYINSTGNSDTNFSAVVTSGTQSVIGSTHQHSVAIDFQYGSGNNHSHVLTARTEIASNVHGHSHSQTVPYSSASPSTTDPPYIEIWHIIKI